MKKITSTLLALLLFVGILAGCAQTSETGNDETINAGPNGEIDDYDLETDDCQEQDLEETIDEGITDDAPHIAAMQLFDDFVMEMYSNDGVVSRERVIEVFGDDYFECDCMEFATVFVITPEVHIHFRSFRGVEGIFDEVHVRNFPAFVTDEELVLNEALFALLQHYGESQEAISFEYIEGLVGRPGIIFGYRHKTFIYFWRSQDILLRANVDNRGVVRDVRIDGEETFEIMFDHLTPETIQEVVENFANLASEMEEDNGFTTRVRVMELFGVDFDESETETGFFMSYDISPDLKLEFSGSDEWVDWIFLVGFSRIFLDEGLFIDGARIREYQENWENFSLEDRPHLSYFEDIIGRAGSLVNYFYGLRLYVWESPDYEVEIWVDENGVVTSLRVLEKLSAPSQLL
jgi:hypothetical protein